MDDNKKTERGGYGSFLKDHQINEGGEGGIGRNETKTEADEKESEEDLG